MPDDECPDPLEGRPEGCCSLASKTGNVWWVKGSTATYTCKLDPPSCSCFAWAYERANSLTPCKHLRYLAAAVEQKECPLCVGGGCVGCAGMGRVPLEEFQALAEMATDDLKEVFA